MKKVIIPSIDLMDGNVVQLERGREKRLELELPPTELAQRFRIAGFESVQVIDLDAALERGSNLEIVKEICGIVKARCGGGVRSVERAVELVESNAERIIVGTAANKNFLNALRAKIGKERIIVALDSFRGSVVVGGWRYSTGRSVFERVRELEPYCSEFFVTVVEREGLMRGTNLAFLRRVRECTRNRLSAAGGIASMDEVCCLERLGIDAVLGMALYTGRIKLGGVSFD